MKRQYIKPYTEIVLVRLNGSVLNSPVIHDQSETGVGMDAKEQGDFFDNGEPFGDLWDTGDGGDSGNSYDLWGE